MADYDPEVAQYVAAVWYVMKEAKRTHAARKPGYSRWAFLNRVRANLDLEPQQAPYQVMRQELLEFASSFGVIGPPLQSKTSEAAKDFSVEGLSILVPVVKGYEHTPEELHQLVTEAVERALADA